MKSKRNIYLDGDISECFKHNVTEYVRIFSSWHKSYSAIKINSNKNTILTSNEFIATFFSGGVDSFYTFLKNKNSISHLIFVHGFDVSLQEIDLRNKISNMGLNIAKEFGVDFIEVETNARKMMKNWGHWGLHAHGLGLGAVARTLSGNFKKIFIPSSFSKDELFPWGTHPALDHLMGDDSLEIVHDGINVTRAEKIEFISESSQALKYLRVCYKNPNQNYNCCECEKMSSYNDPAYMLSVN